MPSTTSVLLLALTALSSALPTTSNKRDVITAQTLIADIKGIDDGTNALTASLNAYNGGLLNETSILDDIAAIEVANRKGYADANLRLAPFSASDAKAIVDYTIASVGVDIPNSVQVLETKKSLFAAEGQQGLILSGLELLKYDHDSFSAVLLEKTPTDEAAGDAVVAKINDALQGGIDDYSS